ncbi:hypothetical protein WICPIJ_000566 [Wickerhamomyces pijperi]|uniref:Uncharacterized protein n=1 Tax=Wickerhamomyces pijperi TaxID=599730 RepID=A0A9P8QCA3_WICPI|nr:hypothetical protein WICPIJ_000566 [Wickerhamomyces pijperi]
MSTASKITLFSTIVTSTITVIWVHKVQDEERAALQQGPIKDEQRIAEKALKKKLLANQRDHEYQQELRKKYEQIQPLSGQINTGEDKPASN